MLGVQRPVLSIGAEDCVCLTRGAEDFDCQKGQRNLAMTSPRYKCEGTDVASASRPVVKIV
jgi:hypothetical protein